jgi:chromosome segregation ATPase
MSEKEIKTTDNSKKKEKKKRGFFLWILILLLLGGNLYMYLELVKLKEEINTLENQNVGLEEERVELKKELEQMLTQYDSLKIENDSLQQDVFKQKEKIKELLDQIEKRKNDRYLIYKYKREAETLRKLLIGYQHQIDSLNQLNNRLRTEKKKVEEALKEKEEQTIQLEKEKEELSQKVTVASRLKALYINPYALKLKKDRTSKKVTKASKTDIIRVCFTLDENQVTEPGNKWLYMRVITPEGTVLHEGEGDEYMFEFEGSRGYYTDKEKIDYQNHQTEVCLDWKKREGDVAFVPGEYIIKIYESGAEIGSTKLELK